MLDLLEQGGQADLLEAVQMVAAGRAIGAHAHGDPMAAEGQEIGDAGAELQVGAGAVNDARAMVPQPAEMPVGEPDAVSEAEVGCEQALVVEVVDFIPPSLEAADDRGFVLLLQGVGVDRPLCGSAGTLVGETENRLALWGGAIGSRTTSTRRVLHDPMASGCGC